MTSCGWLEYVWFSRVTRRSPQRPGVRAALREGVSCLSALISFMYNRRTHGIALWTKSTWSKRDEEFNTVTGQAPPSFRCLLGLDTEHHQCPKHERPSLCHLQGECRAIKIQSVSLGSSIYFPSQGSKKKKKKRERNSQWQHAACTRCSKWRKRP